MNPTNGKLDSGTNSKQLLKEEHQKKPDESWQQILMTDQEKKTSSNHRRINLCLMFNITSATFIDIGIIRYGKPRLD